MWDVFHMGEWEGNDLASRLWIIEDYLSAFWVQISRLPSICWESDDRKLPNKLSIFEDQFALEPFWRKIPWEICDEIIDAHTTAQKQNLAAKAILSPPLHFWLLSAVRAALVEMTGILAWALSCVGETPRAREGTDLPQCAGRIREIPLNIFFPPSCPPRLFEMTPCSL